MTSQKHVCLSLHRHVVHNDLTCFPQRPIKSTILSALIAERSDIYESITRFPKTTPTTQVSYSDCIHIPQLGLAHELVLSCSLRGDGGIGFRVSKAMHCEVPMASSSTTQEALEHTDPQAFRVQQVDLLMALRETIQNPPLGEFRMEDLVWIDHITHGNGRHKGSRMALILWDRLDDFISGEQNHTLYPCRFNVEVIRRNLPNSLRSPRAYRRAHVVRSNLLHYPHPLSLAPDRI